MTNVQRLTDEEKNTEEYKQFMKEYESKIEQHLDVKDQDIDIMDVPQWNRLSIDEDTQSFEMSLKKSSMMRAYLKPIIHH